MQLEVIKVIKPFLDFLMSLDAHQVHNMMVIMLDTHFKALRIVESLVGCENVIQLTFEYDAKVVILLLMVYLNCWTPLPLHLLQQLMMWHWDGLESYNNLPFMLTINVIVVVKAFDNNRRPLNWCSTRVKTNGFKTNVTTFAIAHTWVLGTLCYKATNFCMHNRKLWHS